jgi:hypothetical protein
MPRLSSVCDARLIREADVDETSRSSNLAALSTTVTKYLLICIIRQSAGDCSVTEKLVMILQETSVCREWDQ